jgi:hypothetical protein
MYSHDETIIRKCLKIFVAIAYSGLNLNLILTT